VACAKLRERRKKISVFGTIKKKEKNLEYTLGKGIYGIDLGKKVAKGSRPPRKKGRGGFMRRNQGETRHC